MKMDKENHSEEFYLTESLTWKTKKSSVWKDTIFRVLGSNSLVFLKKKALFTVLVLFLQFIE